MRDWAKADRLLREILARHPGQVEATKLLGEVERGQSQAFTAMPALAESLVVHFLHHMQRSLPQMR